MHGMNSCQRDGTMPGPIGGRFEKDLPPNMTVIIGAKPMTVHPLCVELCPRDVGLSTLSMQRVRCSVPPVMETGITAF